MFVVMTKIEWADVVWNPVTGCSHISEGCRNCYAERLDRRQMWPGRKDGFRPWTAQNAEHNVRLHPDRLEQPLHWKKPRRVFVCSMGDMFHEQVPDKFIDRVFAVMALASNHTLQVLTKRAKRMSEYMAGLGKSFDRLKAACPAGWSMEYEGIPLVRWPLPNVWLGISAEDQPTFDERVPLLLQTPAAKRFVSKEPLLGPISMRWMAAWPENAPETAMNPNGKTNHFDGLRKLDWVIVGGESGPGARPMHPDWVRSIRDDCQRAGVPFFFKQNGEYLPISDAKARGLTWRGKVRDMSTGAYFPEWMVRVGKKRAGRELDGKVWDEVPA